MADAPAWPNAIGPPGPMGPPGPETLEVVADHDADALAHPALRQNLVDHDADALAHPALRAKPPIDAHNNDIANIVADEGVTDDAAAWRALFTNAPLGSTITWRGNSRIASQVICDRRLNLVGEGVGSAITVDVGALNDGLVLAPAAGRLNGVRWSNFAVLGPASAARHALVIRDIARSRIDNVYVKAGADWCVSIEGALICWLNLICPGNNVLFPYPAENAANGIRVVGSASTPANANFIDAIIEAMAGDGLVVDGTVGAAGAFNNWIEGTYEGISGRGILIKGAGVFGWTVSHAHLEAAAGNALRVENAKEGHIGPGARAEAVELVGANDTTLDGVAARALNIDAASHRTEIGKLSLPTNEALVDNGVGTVFRHPIRTSGADAGRAGVGPTEGDNLLRSGGLDAWDTTLKPVGSTIATGTITRTGNGQADTRKLFGESAGKMSGGDATAGGAIYHETLAAQDLEQARGRYVALSAWVFIPSAQVNQPTVVIESNIGGTVNTGESTALTDQWVRLSITSLIPTAATALSLRLRNTNANTGDWYIDATSVVIGRVAPRLLAERRPMRRTAEITWNPGAIANGTALSVNVDVPGATVGDQAQASLTTATANSLLIGARVIAAGLAQVTLANFSGASVDPGEAPLRVQTWGY